MGQDQSRSRDGQPEAAKGQKAGSTAGAGVAGTQGSTIATVPLTGIEGFQVVRLLPYSPAHKAGLVPYFDIITSLDHVLLETEGKPALQFFKSYVANHQDQPVCFTVFNLHIRAYRDVYCVPSDAWGGGGLLGCSIEWSRAESCPERCVHVVDVLEGSPAARSGELCANRDYIIGMQTAQEPLISLIKNQKDFYSRLEGWHEEQRWTLERQQRFPHEAVEVPHVLLFLVYNSESNTVKEVAVEMGTNPEAALGMSVATGLLHVIPSAATSGDAAMATSLPVMNKFVRLEANQTVTRTADVPPPQEVAPPPSAPSTELLPPPQTQNGPQHPRGNGEEAPYRQENQPPQQLPPPQVQLPHDYPQDSTEENPQQYIGNPFADDASLPPAQQQYETDALPPPPPYAPDAAHVSPYDKPPTPYPPQRDLQGDGHAPLRTPPMPPQGNFMIPPPREERPTSVEAAPQAALPVPTPPSAAAVESAPATKKSPFRSALASVEAYERVPYAQPLPPAESKAAAASDSVQHLAAQPVEVHGAVLEQQQEQQQRPAPLVTPPQPHIAAYNPQGAAPAAVPAVVPSPPQSEPHEQRAPSAAAPPPPPQPAAPTYATFSMTNMPPPLHYPVFPAALKKRQQQ